MTQHLPPAHLRVAFALARRSVPVLPLRADKGPMGNCPGCRDNTCGGRPGMKVPGPCLCPAPCHAWAAATTDPDVLTSVAWRSAWRQAGAVGYHPGGAGVTVVDLDNQAAVTWARENLPPTRTVATTRGQHWIYRGTMTSPNGVRPGVDIKSLMAYARWLGAGTGTTALLPDAVRALAVKEEATPSSGVGVASSSPVRATWDRSVATGCRHTAGYVRTALAHGLARVTACVESGAGSQAFAVARFLAAQHTGCPGPCGLTLLGQQITAAAVSVGVPEPYAERAVTRGFVAAGTVS
ncbi:DNA primase [Streptomyces sp. NPDC058279]|uniref:DNA primase n=1 Tax=Streptomyces sp. NPDC058279 TaxID=3346418 RepID=UPI0036ECCCA5